MLRKVLSWALFLPLRLAGYADDIRTLWTGWDFVLNVATSAVTSGVATVVAASQGYGIVGVVLTGVGALLLAFWLTAVGIEVYRRNQANQYVVGGQANTSPTTIIEHANQVYLGQSPTGQNSGESETQGPGKTQGLEPQGQIAPVNEDLGQRCCELYAGLSELIGQWREKVNETMNASGIFAKVYYESQGDPDRKLEIERHDAWMMEEYRKQFARKVLRLSDELAQYGHITPEIQKRLETPKEPQDVDYIAHRLEAICDSSDEG